MFDGHLDGTLLRTLARRTRSYLNRNVAGMSAGKAAVTALLRLRLGNLAKQPQRAGASGA
jgi:hypothetical protein